ncbi:MAG: N-acetylmuramoyl-L-alanine amidase [Cyanobacteriota bacterium]|nr:N-acetylmuramoyl-L-alanine amidase [Cyanobacteriota bacterium]
MTPTQQPLLLAIAGASLLTLGGMAWLARDLVLSPSESGASLQEILEEVRQGKSSTTGPRRAAPPPPQPRSWASPLRESCPAIDGQLQARLAAMQGRHQAGLRRSVAIDPTNYGERHRQDAFGNPLDPTPRVIVLHETVYSLDSALNTFLTSHPRDEDQVSYHTMVGLDGEVVDAVDPMKRAFGAGNSAFNGRWVVTNPKVGGSINNFALHLSLETPFDGRDTNGPHSGYSPEQYDAMALVVADWMARYRIPATAITTHQHVDLGGERSDPRSFDWGELRSRLSALGLGC